MHKKLPDRPDSSLGNRLLDSMRYQLDSHPNMTEALVSHLNR